MNMRMSPNNQFVLYFDQLIQPFKHNIDFNWTIFKNCILIISLFCVWFLVYCSLYGSTNVTLLKVMDEVNLMKAVAAIIWVWGT